MIVSCICLCILLNSEMASEIEELRSHIDLIDAQLQRLTKREKQAQTRKQELMNRLPAIELERARLGQEKEKVTLQLKLVQTKMQQNKQNQEAVREKIIQVEEQLSKRLRALYKKGPLGYTQALLQENELEDLVSSMYYIEHMTKKDKALFFDFLKYKKQLQTAEEELVDLENQENERLTQLEEKKKELNDILKKRKVEIAVLFNKSKERKQLLKRLAEEKRALSELIGKLQSGEQLKGELPHIPITHYKGRLDWPVKGILLRHFGVFRDSQFSTKRKMNGIDIGLKKGQSVKAVYGGKVIYADWFKSYGNLVILDHGNQYITFYAHNDTLMVSKGEIVERNQQIAISGDSGSLEGPFLHFEIREGTKAEDPEKWLKKRRR
ncbi:MAG: hypothetical protein CR997_04255 [Acidobacteria bacterium]|nr:MAG: hypothetical protein CR997_04255 [Acidobacteriota bacterium]